ncbi:DISARM system SNF2-like helicase DrmD [Planctomycetota bacterium]|nr:DISARM system SNF2-like helicase DrmD [Planctomycetota bacterium]
MTLSEPIPLSTATPEAGDLVHLRSRHWLVEEVAQGHESESAMVTLACAEEDAQGEMLSVYWDYELDRKIINEENWASIAQRGFDDQRAFAAFLHTMRWGCVTATDPTLFQSPFRAGIQIDAYQMEPLRKALQLPRVNLFIADDTGLGKTIEAGLIAQELLLRKKIKNIVVSAPPSVLDQWKGELEERFGLIFEILDREYLARVRRERGFGVNPWKTHNRFLVSHKLLIDQTYAQPMRDWLDELQGDDAEGARPGSLLILDEAHHAAPASGNRYGIETKFTRAIRDIAWRFEHRVFLSATPHNGHSSSFSTLLELLDPTRFTRGVKIRGKSDLEKVMVRRIKEDIRALGISAFPTRKIVREVMDQLPADTPELQLSTLLDEYRTLREKRHKSSTKKSQAAAGLLVVGLQQRLLSSIEAFARSLERHIQTVENQWKRAHDGTLPTMPAPSAEFTATTGPDDEERTEYEESPTQEALDAAENRNEEQLLQSLDALSLDEASRDEDIFNQERQILREMKAIADEARHAPDVKMRRLFQWLGEHLCPGLPETIGKAPAPNAQWNERRVLIFTENRQGTKVALRRMLEEIIQGTPEAAQRIATLDGSTATDQRKEIQRRFNADPATEPLRILIATDAAREGLNLQAHCTDLFHFDLPWNPGRLEQRNGRIDRKLQPADEVRCHYFVLPQRIEDRVLDVLVKKTETIQKELGSLSKVIEVDIEKTLARGGIKHSEVESLTNEIDTAHLNEDRRQATEAELEASRERQDDLQEQVDRCERLLEKSRKWIQFQPNAFRDALSCSLELQGLDPLAETKSASGATAWTFPPAKKAELRDPSWKSTLDTLRAPRGPKQRLADWRAEAPIRPVVFDDSGRLQNDLVHLHLQQRVAQRLLSRFRSQGFLHHDLSRACLAQSKDNIPRVVLLGRLELYGAHAERLHEEIVPVSARWIPLDQREGDLRVYARDGEANALELLEASMAPGAGGANIPESVHDQLLAAAPADVASLRPQLDPRAAELADLAEEKLVERGRKESADFLETLQRQRKKVEAELSRYNRDKDQLTLNFDKEEQRQLDENARSWNKRLETFALDESTEPGRIRARYEVRKRRVQPIGLVYLWPESK